MKIAIAYWQGRVSPVFDVSDSLCLIEIENGKEVKRESGVLTSHDSLARAREVSGFGADVLICGAISSGLKMALIDSGVLVSGFICGDMDAVLSAFLCGQLTDGRFFMPGCHGEQLRNRCRGRHKRRQVHHG